MNRSGLSRFIRLIAGRMIKWTTVDGQGGEFGWLHATMPPADLAEGEQNLWQSVRSMIGFGFRSAPVAGSELIVTAPRCGPVNAVAVASDHLGYGPTDLSEGDTVLYSSAHKEGIVAIVRVYADGNIRIQTSKDACHVIAKPGTGGKVKLGDDADANLDPVVLYTQLKAEYDNLVSTYNNHSHVVPGITAGFASVTSNASLAVANNLSVSVASSNVVAKKP